MFVGVVIWYADFPRLQAKKDEGASLPMPKGSDIDKPKKSKKRKKPVDDDFLYANLTQNHAHYFNA